MHELRRPRAVLRIRRDRARLDRAGAGLNRVVDEIKTNRPRGEVVVLRRSVSDLDVRAAEIFSDQRQVRFGDGEIGVDRIEILDRDQDGAALLPGSRISDIDLRSPARPSIGEWIVQ